MWDRRAKLVEVHDGDTVRMLLDQGENDYKKLWVRLKDVFAPELTEEGGIECTRFVGAWFNARTTQEWPFIVVTERTQSGDTHDVMTFDRYVATIYTNDDEKPGACLNTAIQDYITVNGYSGGIGS